MSIMCTTSLNVVEYVYIQYIFPVFKTLLKLYYNTYLVFIDIAIFSFTLSR